MDVVDALNRYRFAVARDPEAFAILSYLYINDWADEKELAEALNLQFAQTKSRIRELYKARLLDLVGSGAVRITAAASTILAGLNADEHLMPELLRTATANPYRSVSEELYKLATKADRNLKVEIRDRVLEIAKLPDEASPAVTNYLILFSMVPPDSVSRSALETLLMQVKKTGTSPFEDKKAEGVYTRLSRAIHDSDALLRHAAAALPEPRNFTDAGKSYTMWRLFSYLRTQQTDPVLEASRLINPNLAESVIDLSFKKIRTGSFFYESCEMAARVWDMPSPGDGPHRMISEVSELFRKVFEQKYLSTFDDVVALIPPSSESEGEQGGLSMEELVSLLNQVVAQVGENGVILGAETQRAQAQGLLTALQKMIEAKPKNR